MTRKYQGKWRITEMGRWDADFIDLIVPGYIRFDAHGVGEFQLGTVHGHIQYRAGGYEDGFRLLFAWEGAIESALAKGTGWAEMSKGGLKGHIYIQDGDDSRFKASRVLEEEKQGMPGVGYLSRRKLI